MKVRDGVVDEPLFGFVEEGGERFLSRYLYLRYLYVSFKSMAIAKHRSQHNFAQFISFSHILA